MKSWLAGEKGLQFGAGAETDVQNRAESQQHWSAFPPFFLMGELATTPIGTETLFPEIGAFLLSVAQKGSRWFKLKLLSSMCELAPGPVSAQSLFHVVLAEFGFEFAGGCPALAHWQFVFEYVGAEQPSSLSTLFSAHIDLLLLLPFQCSFIPAFLFKFLLAQRHGLLIETVLMANAVVVKNEQKRVLTSTNKIIKWQSDLRSRTQLKDHSAESALNKLTLLEWLFKPEIRRKTQRIDQLENNLFKVQKYGSAEIEDERKKGREGRKELPKGCQMASRIHKKNRAVEEQTDDHDREHYQSELFPLEYLHHSITYLLAKPQDQSYLHLDPTALELVISEDPSRLGLHFVERMKLMKESCEPEQFMKDYQECGDFINYDLSREHQQRLRSIEAQLKQENEKQIEIKRVFRPIQRVSLPELQRRQSAIKQGILATLLKDYDMVVQIKQNCLPSNSPINEIPSITCSKQEIPSISASLQEPPQESVTQKGKVENEKTKKGPKPEKARKIKKQAKKGEGKADFQEEYIPNVGKRGGRFEEYLPSPLQKRQYNMDSAGPESSQYVMPRRSNQYFQDKQSKYEDSSFKDESHEVRSQKIVPPSHSRRKHTKNTNEGKAFQPKGRPKLNSAGNKQSQKSQIFEDQASVPREGDLQSIGAGQMMEVEDVTQKALAQRAQPDEADGEGDRRHVSIGIQTFIDHSEELLFQEEEAPPEAVQDINNGEECRNQEEDISSLLKLD